MTAARDRWAEWLAVRRFGGDPETRRRFLAQLSARRDKVLDLAQLAEGETLLDVGCGEGLIAFGALELGAGRVIFSDVSRTMSRATKRIVTVTQAVNVSSQAASSTLGHVGLVRNLGRGSLDWVDLREEPRLGTRGSDTP